MRRWLIRGAGLAAILVALAFLGHSMWQAREGLLEFRPDAAMLARLVALSAVYGAALLLLAESWHRIAGLFGAEPRWRTFPSYTTTLVARYLPGNVMHLLGRAAWLRGGALSDRALAKATGLELLVTPLGAGCAAILVLPVLRADALTGLVPIPPGALAAIGLALVLAAHAVPSLRRFLRPLTRPVLLAMSFMLCLAGVFAGVAATVADVPFATAMIAALVSWLAGYATPGAPGGLGPREAVVTALLATAVPMESALLIALLFRLVTTLGELMCFAAGYPLGRLLLARHPAGQLQPGA